MSIPTSIINIIQRAGFIPACCVLLLTVGMLLSVSSARAQGPTEGTGQESVPPVKRDSVFKDREVKGADSLATPFTTFGQIGSSVHDTSLAISKADRRYFQYRSLSELLIRSTPYMPLSHGGNAQHNNISILGGYNADNAVSYNGRTIVDPWSNAFHLAQAAPEGLERTEILTGVNALGLAADMTLSAINMQEIRHNSATPYTALWYTQGGGEVIAADGTFSQNVAPGLNVTVGVRRSGAADARYVNTDYDVWNVRAAVRYAMSAQTNFGLAYQLASLNTGLSGGLRTLIPPEDLTERTASPVFFTLQDESRRHDLTATLMHMWDADTMHTITAQAYASSVDMLRLRDSTLRTSAADSIDYLTFHGRQAGLLLRSDNTVGPLHLHTGASVDVVTNDSTVYTESFTDVRPQLFGHMRLSLTDALSLTGAARFKVHNATALIGVGGGIEWQLPSAFFSADISTAQRPPSAAEGLDLSPERHLLATATFRTAINQTWFMGQAFYRLVDQPLTTLSDRDSLQFIRSTLTTNGSSYSIAGLVAHGMIVLPYLELRPVLRLHVEPGATEDRQRFPLLSGELTAAFVYKVDANSVRLGVKGAFVSPMASRQYVPLTWTYTTSTQTQPWVGNGLDVFLTAILGNASVRLSWENLLAETWYTTAVAPEIFRDLRLSLTWSFFD